MLTTTTHSMSAQLEDAEFLAQTGENLPGALKRLGYQNNKGLHRLCARHNRLDIYNTLSGRELL